MAETVTFDGNDLASVSGLSIIGTDPHRPSVRDLNSAPLARIDRSIVTSAFYTSRKIHVLASLQASSKANLQSALRTLESLLQTKEGLLVFSIAGVSTQFTATKNNIMLSNEAGGFAELDIEFYCSDPMGYAVSSTTLYNYAALVGGSYSFAVTWSGNVTQQPVITITLNNVTGGTAKTITVSNPTTGVQLNILRTWANSDILIINSKTKTVTVNGVDISFTGGVPEWSVKQPINYADDFTTRNIAVNLVYQIRNL